MQTDMIAEEEFEIKEEEPWYDHQDLEHDLHLAAELGKSLLERNHELEQTLQQMYTTNQEQQQEIEYLSKQVDMLRSVNDQHAKVYEQLDMTARDLEQSNQRLVLDNRSAQLKIEGLTETINGLQCQVEELQREIQELKAGSSETTPDVMEPQWPARSPTLPYWKEQYQSNKFPPYEHCGSTSTPSVEESDWEEEQVALWQSVETLQAQLNTECALREAAERDADALAREVSELESCVVLLKGYKSRLAELEAEVEEFRQLWRRKSSVGGTGQAHSLFLHDTVFFPFKEEDMNEIWQRRRMLKRCSSEIQLRESSSEEGGLRDPGHSKACRGHSEMTKYNQGVSLLTEVDAEYSALQRKYNALLRHCEDHTQPQSHKAVQTTTHHQPLTPPSHQHTTRASAGVSTQDNAPLPEYKVLFHEIFTCIQRSKENLRENKGTSS